MSKRNAISTLMILIASLAAFTAGVGASFWEKVETVNAENSLIGVPLGQR